MDKLQKEFSKIYDKYIEKIYRFIFLKVNSPEIAEDLTSETFLRGWKAFQETQNPKSQIKNPQAFLYQIAKNLVVDFYREKGKAQLLSAQEREIPDNQSLEEKTFLKSEIEEILLALSQLKEEYQEVITWYYLEELPVSEIAKLLNKSEGATRVLIHRALNSLREILSSVNKN